MRILKATGRAIVLSAVIPYFPTLGAGEALAQGATQEITDVCLKTGVKVRATKIEAREGKFLIYPSGVNSPMEVATNQIQTIGDPGPCGAPPVSTIAPTKFSIRGSNTIGERLMPMLIDAYTTKNYGKPAAFNARGPEEQDIEIRGADGSRPVATIDFQAKGSGTAPAAMKARQISIGMMSRRMKSQEADEIRLAQNIDPMTPGNEHVLALDGLAVIVHPHNPIKKMSLAQVAGIFGGEVANWKDVRGKDARDQDISGPDMPIRVHARDDRSGTFDTFKSIVLDRDEPKRKITGLAKRYESSEALSDAVTQDVSSIGFIGFPYINKNHPLGVTTDCGLTHVASRYAVKTEEYPLARRLYLYTLGAPAEPVAKELLEFTLSDEAQKTVFQAGFIDQSMEYQQENEQKLWTEKLVANPRMALPQDKEVPAASVRTFAAAMRDMRRTSFVFRFERGVSELDVRARQDIGRLARHLSQPTLAGRAFFVVGFADSDGAWQYNHALAANRANAVASQLQAHGVRIPRGNIQAYSYMAPVACNTDDNGRAKNRRVEVWVAR